MVTKRDGNGTLRKKPSRKGLEALNNVATPDRIQDVNSMAELHALLSALESLAGSKHTYSGQELALFVQKVSEGRADINTITRETGLRQKVAELLKR